MHPFRTRADAGAPVVVLAAMLTLASCSEQSTTAAPLAPAEGASLVVVSGDAQRGAVGVELAAPLVVKAVKANGNPLPLQIVNFHVVSGGGSVFAGSSITDAHGVAQEYWTLGTAPGPNVLEVRAVDPTTGEKQTFATFTATGMVGPIARVTVSPATGSIVEDATLSLTAAAEDRFGNAVVDRPFTWSSANDAIASVSSTGLVTGKLAGGPVSISASADGVSGSASITVTPKAIPPDAFEPNFGFNPTQLGFFTPGQLRTVSATINDLVDEDWYRVGLSKVGPSGCVPGVDYTRTFTIDLTNIAAGSDYGLDIRLIDQGLPPIASSLNPGNSPEQIVHEVTGTCGVGGTEFLLVRVFRQAGAPSATLYRLSFNYQ